MLQLIAVALSTLLFLASQFEGRFKGYLLKSSLSLSVLYGLSLVYTRPPAHGYTLALQRVFPRMPAELADQVIAALLLPIIGALLCVALQIVWRRKVLHYLTSTLLVGAQLGLLELILVLCMCLASCQPKPGPAAAAPAGLPGIDTLRQTLQQRADTSRTRADQAGQSSQSTVTNYQRDAKTYDSIRVNLP